MDVNNTENQYVIVKKSGIHNTGVFAKKFIPKGTKIIQYVGEKISKKESDRRSDIVIEESRKDKEKGAVYIFEINNKYDLDGNVPYNTARYINHSCHPNSESENIKEEIWIISLRDINEGEEILYNYGYGIDSFDEHPCLCGAEDCIGYIASENKWEKLKKIINKNYKNKKVLVAYYSRTGNTKKVATYLANYMGFDIDEITTDNRQGVLGYVKSGYESATKTKPRIKFEKNPANYDLIIIATPIWANTISSPIMTYLGLCKKLTLAAICTMGGNDNGSAFQEIAKASPSFKGLVNLKTSTINQNKYQNKLIEFFRTLE